ncbi:MFS transporter [Sphingomonas oligoaromativorans]|uniref:MFS transporter n=1 Tax=Sphingomonas oligoaromativorans TaxID=575322 RepID=UPI001422E5CB|nr:MFS transporter [Sphingomonas oligoaromativorans]NIJ34790.1 DHA2 family multidrug resistance protein [Sphingomonas oligoaromativorans]
MPALSAPAEGRPLLSGAALLAIYMQAVNISLPNAAVLHIQGSLSMTDDEIGWVFSSYIMASAMVMPMTRWLAGAFGRKTVMLTSLALFALGLILDTQATTALQFVFARIFQGAASGPLAPLAMAILLEGVPPERQPRRGLLSTVIGLAGMLSGPAIGGIISEYHDWRLIFVFGLPLTGLIFLTMALYLIEQKPRQNPPFDFFGLATLALGMIGLQMLLDRGERMEWFASTESCIEAAAAALGFYLFLVHVLTAERHFLNKALFRDRNFAFSTVMFFALGFVLLPTLALTSPMLEELLGYPADTTGYMTLPRGAALIGALAITATAPKWIDSRLLVVTGIGLTALGNWVMLGYSPLMDWRYVLVAGTIQGAGLGILMAALSKTAFSTLAPGLRPEGTALFTLARLYGSTIGIAIVQVLFYNHTQMMHLALAKNLTPHHATGPAAGLFAGAGLPMLNELLTGQAAIIALINQFKLMMIVILAVSPLALLLRKSRPLN